MGRFEIPDAFIAILRTFNATGIPRWGMLKKDAVKKLWKTW